MLLRILVPLLWSPVLALVGKRRKTKAVMKKDRGAGIDTWEESVTIFYTEMQEDKDTFRKVLNPPQIHDQITQWDEPEIMSLKVFRTETKTWSQFVFKTKLLGVAFHSRKQSFLQD